MLFNDRNFTSVLQKKGSINFPKHIVHWQSWLCPNRIHLSHAFWVPQHKRSWLDFAVMMYNLTTKLLCKLICCTTEGDLRKYQLITNNIKDRLGKNLKGNPWPVSSFIGTHLGGTGTPSPSETPQHSPKEFTLCSGRTSKQVKARVEPNRRTYLMRFA